MGAARTSVQPSLASMHTTSCPRLRGFFCLFFSFTPNPPRENKIRHHHRKKKATPRRAQTPSRPESLPLDRLAQLPRWEFPSAVRVPAQSVALSSGSRRRCNTIPSRRSAKMPEVRAGRMPPALSTKNLDDWYLVSLKTVLVPTIENTP